MQPETSGTVISGLIKSVTDEPDGEGRTRVTTQRYDPESSPPVKVGEPVIEILVERI